MTFFEILAITAFILTVPLAVAANLLTERIKAGWAKRNEHYAKLRALRKELREERLLSMFVHPAVAVGYFTTRLLNIVGLGALLLTNYIIMWIPASPLITHVSARLPQPSTWLAVVILAAAIAYYLYLTFQLGVASGQLHRDYEFLREISRRNIQRQLEQGKADEPPNPDEPSA